MYKEYLSVFFRFYLNSGQMLETQMLESLWISSSHFLIDTAPQMQKSSQWSQSFRGRVAPTYKIEVKLSNTKCTNLSFWGSTCARSKGWDPLV